MLTVAIDVALPNEGTKIMTTRAVILVSTTYPDHNLGRQRQT
jgi:hypothetical protein